MSQVHSMDPKFPLLGSDPAACLPPRSRLVPLPPLGLGTPYRESLGSYFQRLADVHSLSPKVLARELVFPGLRLSGREKASQADRFWRTSFFSGMGQVPKAWVEILESLTSLRGLGRFTLLPLQGRVGLPGVHAPGRKWCPLCLQEGAAEGAPYGQLLWEVGAVRACPKHGIKLVETCTCGGSRPRPRFSTKYLPHLCESCGNSLSCRPGMELEPAPESDLRRSALVADLLGSGIFEVNSEGAAANLFPSFLKRVVEELAEGNAARFARMVGVSKGSMSEWLHGQHLPSLAQALSIAEACGVGLADILTGNGQEALRAARPQTYFPPFRKPRVARKCDPRELEAKLVALMEAEPPVSVAEAARLTGTSARNLYHLHPQLSRSLALRCARRKQEDAARRREERLHLVREATVRMAKAGLLPTRRRLESQIEGVPKFFLSAEGAACRKILIEVRSEILGMDPPGRRRAKAVKRGPLREGLV